MKICAAFALSLALLLTTSCHKKTAFELAHDKAVLGNPYGVKMRIATIDGRVKFRLSESVPIEELYTADYAGQWHLEVLDGWNGASVSEEFHVANGQTSSLIHENYGVICCDSRHVWLSSEPTRIPYAPKVKSPFIPINIPSPGTYQIYVTSHRVFDKDQTLHTDEGLGYAVTSSNILRVEVDP